MTDLVDRAAGVLIGLAAGRSLALGGGPDGGLALALILADELAAGRRDVRSLAQRWVARHVSDPRDIDPETGAALTHLAWHDAPPSRGAGTGSDPLVRVIPVALGACDAPRALVSATYHLVALTHPEPVVAWSAVAVNVALARLLQGHRDFVPDVIEALRTNDVPEPLLAAVRRVPLPPSTTAQEHSVPGQALDDAEAALRCAYHDPLLERGVRHAASGAVSAGRAGLTGALLGARDGWTAIPTAWRAEVDAETLQRLAARLVRPEPASVSPNADPAPIT